MKSKVVYEKRNVNFFLALRRYEQIEEHPEKRGIVFPALLLCTVLLLGGVVYLLGETDKRLDVEVAALRNYVQSDQNVEAMKYQAQLQQDIGFLAAYNMACAQHIEYLQNADRLGSTDFELMASKLPGDTRILEYRFESGLLTIFCETSDRSAPSRFAEDLTKLAAFQEITYEGFQMESTEKQLLSFSITCKLWP